MQIYFNIFLLNNKTSLFLSWFLSSLWSYGLSVSLHLISNSIDKSAVMPSVFL